MRSNRKLFRMDAETAITFVVLAVLFGGIPLAGILYAGKQPKAPKPTQQDIYPDDHLFI